MIIKTDYEIPVPDGVLEITDDFKELIEANSEMFERSVMSRYDDDSGYTYLSESFKVNDVESEDGITGSFSFEVEVDYYHGCKDKRGILSRDYTIDFSFDTQERLIKFKLDETSWKLDN